METLKFLATLGISATVMMGGVAFLIKLILKHWLDKDIELFKEKIKHDHEKAISEYQSTLEKERIRLQISYGGIFEKQAEAIIELHKLLIEVEATINDALYETEDDSSKTLFLEKRNALNKFLNENRIIIPEIIDNKLYEFQRKAYLSVMNYRSAQDHIERLTTNPNVVNNMLERQQKAQSDIDSLKELREELVKETRRLMGVFDGEIST